MRLETGRLVLRTPRKGDWEDILEGARDLDVARNLLALPHPYRKADATGFIALCMKKQGKKNCSEYDFFIELKSERKVIGVTSIHAGHEDKNVGVTGS